MSAISLPYLLATIERMKAWIFCIGEVLEEREANKQNEVVAAQMESVFSLSAEDFFKIVLAYEPIQKIGVRPLAKANFTFSSRIATVSP